LTSASHKFSMKGGGERHTARSANGKYKIWSILVKRIVKHCGAPHGKYLLSLGTWTNALLTHNFGILYSKSLLLLLLNNLYISSWHSRTSHWHWHNMQSALAGTATMCFEVLPSVCVPNVPYVMTRCPSPCW
jgi:hypothetical protein